MVVVILIVLSAAIILALGAVHLLYTFWGTKLTPRDRSLQSAMTATSPVISAETTMWKAWIGFNASHSCGAVLFGLVYGYLAFAHPVFLFQSSFLLIVGLVFLIGWTALARRYWFNGPLAGILVAFASFGAGCIAGLTA
jgi:hypothetical protein